MENAARVTSAVEHRNFIIRGVGSIGGIAVGAAIVYYSRGKGVMPAIGAAEWLRRGGVWLDNRIQLKSASESIARGVPNVSLEEAKHAAANTSGKTRTDKHNASPRTGSDSVFIDGHNASRRGDIVECNGLILDGAPNIFYGGTQLSAKERAEEQVPLGLKVLEGPIKIANEFKPPLWFNLLLR